jgi:hypothetical protein
MSKFNNEFDFSEKRIHINLITIIIKYKILGIKNKSYIKFFLNLKNFNNNTNIIF